MPYNTILGRSRIISLHKVPKAALTKEQSSFSLRSRLRSRITLKRRSCYAQAEVCYNINEYKIEKIEIKTL